MGKKFVGIGLSYLLIVVDISVGIFFVPFLLKALKSEEYGLYKLMVSTASYLSVLDFGIGGTITRYVVKFRTENKRREEENLLGMGFLIYGGLSLLVVIIAVAISALIPIMYNGSISAEQFTYAQTMFLVICANTAVNLFNHAYNGLLLAYEKYSFQKITNIVKVLLRVLLIIVIFLKVKMGIFIAIVDLVLSISLLVVNMIYSKYRLKCRIKLHNWDTVLLKEVLIFTLAILAQSVINQFNSNVDNIVLGIFSTTTAAVAMYSIALQLFNMYSSLSTAVSYIYLPSVSKAVFKGEDDDAITERVVAPSRIQLVVLLLALSGFLLFGNDFITLWVGKSYKDAYLITSILFISATLELSQNSITSVLKAKNILHGKTLILGISTLVNIILTVVLVPPLGPVGAAIGTAFSMVFGYGLALNIYYKKKAKLNMKLYYKKTYKGILLAAAVSSVIGIGIWWLVSLINCNIYLTFAIEGIAYVCVYATIMLLIGLNKQEKEMVKSFMDRILKRFVLK